MSACSLTGADIVIGKPSGADLLVHIFPQIIFFAVNGQFGLDAVEGEGAYLVAQLAEAPKVQGVLVVLFYGRDLDGAARALVLAAYIAERGFKLALPQRGERVFPRAEVGRPPIVKNFPGFRVVAGAVPSRFGAVVVFPPARQECIFLFCEGSEPRFRRRARGAGGLVAFKAFDHAVKQKSRKGIYGNERAITPCRERCL